MALPPTTYIREQVFAPESGQAEIDPEGKEDQMERVPVLQRIQINGSGKLIFEFEPCSEESEEDDGLSQKRKMLSFTFDESTDTLLVTPGKRKCKIITSTNNGILTLEKKPSPENSEKTKQLPNVAIEMISLANVLVKYQQLPDGEGLEKTRNFAGVQSRPLFSGEHICDENDTASPGRHGSRKSYSQPSVKQIRTCAPDDTEATMHQIKSSATGSTASMTPQIFADGHRTRKSRQKIVCRTGKIIKALPPKSKTCCTRVRTMRRPNVTCLERHDMLESFTHIALNSGNKHQQLSLTTSEESADSVPEERLRPTMSGKHDSAGFPSIRNSGRAGLASASLPTEKRNDPADLNLKAEYTTLSILGKEICAPGGASRSDSADTREDQPCPPAISDFKPKVDPTTSSVLGKESWFLGCASRKNTAHTRKGQPCPKTESDNKPKLDSTTSSGIGKKRSALGGACRKDPDNAREDQPRPRDASECKPKVDSTTSLVLESSALGGALSKDPDDTREDQPTPRDVLESKPKVDSTTSLVLESCALGGASRNDPDNTREDHPRTREASECKPKVDSTTSSLLGKDSWFFGCASRKNPAHTRKGQPRPKTVSEFKPKLDSTNSSGIGKKSINLGGACRKDPDNTREDHPRTREDSECKPKVDSTKSLVLESSALGGARRKDPEDTRKDQPRRRTAPDNNPKLDSTTSSVIGKEIYPLGGACRMNPADGREDLPRPRYVSRSCGKPEAALFARIQQPGRGALFKPTQSLTPMEQLEKLQAARKKAMDFNKKSRWLKKHQE